MTVEIGSVSSSNNGFDHALKNPKKKFEIVSKFENKTTERKSPNKVGSKKFINDLFHFLVIRRRRNSATEFKVSEAGHHKWHDGQRFAY